MNSIQTSTNDQIAQRLDRLAQLFQIGQASDLMVQTLDKLFAHEIQQSLHELEQLRVDLVEFEERYGMTSAEFYRQYQAGEIDDRMDYVEWASLVQMADNLQQRLDVLAGE
jgi:hypothetical protein